MNSQTKEQFWNEWKCQPCAKCGQRFHPSQMDAHHVDPGSKDMDHRFSIKNLNRTAMERELKKCIPLCKNCHAFLHWQLRMEEVPAEEGKSCAWPRLSQRSELEDATMRLWRQGKEFKDIARELGIDGKRAKRIVNKCKHL